MVNHPLQAEKIWDCVIKIYASTELIVKQVYAWWAELNKEQWRLNDDQAVLYIPPHIPSWLRVDSELSEWTLSCPSGLWAVRVDSKLSEWTPRIVQGQSDLSE